MTRLYWLISRSLGAWARQQLPDACPKRDGAGAGKSIGQIGVLCSHGAATIVLRVRGRELACRVSGFLGLEEDPCRGTQRCHADSTEQPTAASRTQPALSQQVVASPTRQDRAAPEDTVANEGLILSTLVCSIIA